MEIQVRTKCKDCDGVGVICHPSWMEFYKVDDKFRKDNNGAIMTQRQVDEWFSERGFGTLPPEETECHECEGTGEVSNWIDILNIIPNLDIGHLKNRLDL